MGDPHNPDRIGEEWNPHRLRALHAELDAIRGYGVISGGWAWHLMSPPHREVKHLHDHKDIDVFVFPEAFAELVVMLKERGYQKAWTRFDDPSSEFIRFTRYIEASAERPETVKVILDLFVEQVPHIEVVDGYKVVEPVTLLGYYSDKHESRECIAVLAAKQLAAAGEPIAGNRALVGEWSL